MINDNLDKVFCASCINECNVPDDDAILHGQSWQDDGSEAGTWVNYTIPVPTGSLINTIHDEMLNGKTVISVNVDDEPLPLYAVTYVNGTALCEEHLDIRI